MTLLKKIGQIVLRVIGIATGVMPLIQQATAASPTASAVEDKLVAAFNVVLTAEQMFTAASGPTAKTGSQKLLASTPYIAVLVQSLPVFSGKKPKDEAAFETHCKALASCIADIFNDYGD